MYDKGGLEGGEPSEMSEAMDGRREAHMDVLVAVFGRLPPLQPPRSNNT